ncbi:MAG: hypothetical protein IKA17_03205 [Clostridia bacterium]|nr:hypothetical protein [Clostridia bacterium]
MIKERIKSSVIILLIVNIIFLTSKLWFVYGSRHIGEEIIKQVKSLPVISSFFPTETPYSIPKENLSKPRKFLINDGSLWMAYYNTDIGYSPIEERIRTIVKGFLRGDISASKKTDYETWQAGLESYSIYVEYPISYSMELFSKVMDVDPQFSPKDISSLRDFIIIPSSSETDVCILVRDYNDNSKIYAYILNPSYQFPASDLNVYANSGDGYYEPAFSTGLMLETKNNISLYPMVLFSDSQPESSVLSSSPLINEDSQHLLLENFSINSATKPYTNQDGTKNYIENYASAKIYTDAVFEYVSINNEKGIILNESGDAYAVLNSAIDFAENIWKCVSDEPLNVLLTSDLSDYDSQKPFKFEFDYYCNGRPVNLSLKEENGHEALNSAIEITVYNGMLVSYRQNMREYNEATKEPLSAPFISALDYFVKILDEEGLKNAEIKDIYIGYLDKGTPDLIKANWLCKVDNKIYSYIQEAEVAQ